MIYETLVLLMGVRLPTGRRGSPAIGRPRPSKDVLIPF